MGLSADGMGRDWMVSGLVSGDPDRVEISWGITVYGMWLDHWLLIID